MVERRRPKVWVSQPVLGASLQWLGHHLDLATTTGEVISYTFCDLAACFVSLDDGLFRLDQSCGPVEIAAASRLRAIAGVAVDHHNFDIVALSATGMRISSPPDTLAETTADLGVPSLIAAARRVSESERRLRARRWGKRPFLHYAGR